MHSNGVCPYDSGSSVETSNSSNGSLNDFEYDEDRGIYYGEWGIIDEDGYFHSYNDGEFDEDGNFYLYDELEWCAYCDGTVYPGQDHVCLTYDYPDAPDYCYDCENIIEDRYSDHDEECPSHPDNQEEATVIVPEETPSGPEEEQTTWEKVSEFMEEQSLYAFFALFGIPLALYLYNKAAKKIFKM